MADLPDFESRKRALLKKCDEAYALGEAGRSYVDKHGEKHSQPDVAACIKCIELAARIMGVLAEAEKRVKLADDEQRAVDIETVANLLRGVGYRVEKAA
jgi:hypothetical protein